MFPKVISFCTKNTPYEGEAKDLIASCEKFGLEYEIDAIDSKGSWEKNQSGFETIKFGLKSEFCNWLKGKAKVHDLSVRYFTICDLIGVGTYAQEGFSLCNLDQVTREKKKRVLECIP